MSDNTQEKTEDASGTPFEQAIRVWGEVALTSLQKKLDDEGIKMMENQKNAVVSRKELATRTKGFRKMEDDEKLGEIKGLLKMYQTEIDSLTNRSKYAETAFMDVYKVLSEAPDPKPLLEASIDSVHSASEASRLMKENARLQELNSKHADYETIKAKLLKLEQSSIECAHAKVQAKEAEMKALMDEKERSWKLKEEELNREIKELRENSEVTQAQLSKNTNDNEPTGNRIAELELVARDLERANSRVLEMEKRNVELRQELESFKSGTKESDEKDELEKRISSLEGENSKLAAKIDSNKTALEQTENEKNQKLSTLERELSYKSQETETLRSKLSAQYDYDDIKRELDVMKSIEFSMEEEEKTEEESGEGEKLEKMLLARNKKLNDDLTMLRVSNQGLETETTNLKTKISQTEAQLEEVKKLNSKLEQDMATLQETPSDTMSVATGWNWGSMANAKQGKSSPTSSIIGGNTGAASTRGGGPEAGRGNDNSILPIITQQRDRFRTRNAELEQELKKTWQQITSLRKELETVKQDNVELYEKTRYASTFRAGAAEDRYRHAYEEGLTPYQQFKGREAERLLSTMNPLERITYSFTRVILANRFSRNLFMVYCIGLHLLVMTVVMYSVGHSTAAAGLQSSMENANTNPAVPLAGTGSDTIEEVAMADPPVE